MIWVRSIFFFCGMAISAVLFCPIALIVWPVPVVARMRIIGLWARFIGWWLTLTCQLRFEVEGMGTLAITTQRHFVQTPIGLGNHPVPGYLPAADLGIEARGLMATIFWLGPGSHQPHRDQSGDPSAGA